MICKPVKNNNGPRKEMRLSKRRLCRDMVAFLRPDMGLVGREQKKPQGEIPLGLLAATRKKGVT